MEQTTVSISNLSPSWVSYAVIGLITLAIFLVFKNIITQKGVNKTFKVLITLLIIIFVLFAAATLLIDPVVLIFVTPFAILFIYYSLLWGIFSLFKRERRIISQFFLLLILAPFLIGLWGYDFLVSISSGLVW